MLDETLISNPILDLHALFQLYVHQSFLQEPTSVCLERVGILLL